MFRMQTHLDTMLTISNAFVFAKIHRECLNFVCKIFGYLLCTASDIFCVNDKHVLLPYMWWMVRTDHLNVFAITATAGGCMSPLCSHVQLLLNAMVIFACTNLTVLYHVKICVCSIICILKVFLMETLKKKSKIIYINISWICQKLCRKGKWFVCRIPQSLEFYQISSTIFESIKYICHFPTC